ncbi:MAG: TRAP transporter large permease, partial [Rhodospirillaceae bacterium]|nr:TRAP transporter large permease [Rhodospirillaceae bacterium]
TVRWLEALGALLMLLVLALLAWRLAVHALNAGHRGEETTILRLPMAPFLFALAALVAICVPVQAVVLVRALRALGRQGAMSLNALAVVILSTAALVAIVLAFDAWQPVLKNHGLIVAAAGFFLLWGLILAVVPVGAALAAVGFAGTVALFGLPRALSVVGSEAGGVLISADLAVIPLFLMMGGFAMAGGLSADIYRLAQAMFGFQRGGLALATIGGCAGFGALTGSSLATAATIGSAALPQMRERGYSTELSTGCVAAGATLGQLVPPSTAVVVYAILTEQSIGKLYIAILGPAVLTILLYMVAIALYVRLVPSAAPGSGRFDAAELRAALARSFPVVSLFAVVIGGIYFGLFTATEAAGIGAVMTFVVALLRGKLRGGAIWQVAAETTRSTSMIYLLMIGAMIISFFLGVSGLPEYLTRTIGESGLPALAIIALLVLMFVALGTVMDSFAIMIVTTPLVAPLVQSLGYDPIWWGIMMVALVELGVVTPPFGLNLFMLKSLMPETPMAVVFRGVVPFVAADVVKIALLIAFPGIALFLIR